ncbi:unnamed protein product [Aureobasidium uvarum]|uniref:Uncharacterized protein n=1 Tax=Aureobasidium uvarum TaxID=2773716 RepID=A0A9N8KM16_9PEZI|nr:unnamed protein product [Aureobasidium uvarum]
MPPCLYICCHFEITDDHHSSPSRPKSNSKAIQDGRRISRHHSHTRERQGQSPRGDKPRERSHERHRHHSRHRSPSSPVRHIPQQAHQTSLILTLCTQQRSHHQNLTTSPSTQNPLSATQDQHPANQVKTLRQNIENEDTRHTLTITKLHETLDTEHARHDSRTKDFRSRLIDLSTAHQHQLRLLPKKLQQQQQQQQTQTANDDGKTVGDNTAVNKQGYIAKWLDGLKSMSSFSGARDNSSDGDSSVEVVAAKDAKGKGKGIRIVSDGVEEGGGGDV